MAAQIMNFKKLEVTGATKEEALAKAPFQANYKNATPAFNLWKKKQTRGITDADVKQFCLEYLAKNTKNAAGLGCYIVKESAVADTRQRPYVIEDIKGEGERVVAKVFELRDDATGAILASTPVVEKNKTVKLKDDEGNPVLDKDGKPRYEEVLDEDGNNIKVLSSATKNAAKDLGRKLYTEEGFTGNLTAYITKQVVKGEPIAFRMKYAPSKNARVGSYIVFGVEA
jgi:hypothetical protein